MKYLVLLTIIFSMGCSTFSDSTASRGLANFNNEGGHFELNRDVFENIKSDCCNFPLNYPSLLEIDNKTTRSHFGAERANDRLKASANVVGYVGSSVSAIADGKFLKKGYWQGDSYSVSILTDGVIIRYAGIELSEKILEMKEGDVHSIKKGDVLGVISEIPNVEAFRRAFGAIRIEAARKTNLLDKPVAPLYIEIYVQREGVDFDEDVYSPNFPPYQRRNDLVDPTSFLKKVEEDSFK